MIAQLSKFSTVPTSIESTYKNSIYLHPRGRVLFLVSYLHNHSKFFQIFMSLCVYSNISSTSIYQAIHDAHLDHKLEELLPKLLEFNSTRGPPCASPR